MDFVLLRPSNEAWEDHLSLTQHRTNNNRRLLGENDKQTNKQTNKKYKENTSFYCCCFSVKDTLACLWKRVNSRSSLASSLILGYRPIMQLSEEVHVNMALQQLFCRISCKVCKGKKVHSYEW